MGASYASKRIRAASEKHGHVPLIDRNQRRVCNAKQKRPHEKERNNERGSVERFNGRLKEEFGGKNVMVRGAEKVMLHLMFGVVSIFADQLLKIAAS